MRILLDTSALETEGNGKQFWSGLTTALSSVAEQDELIILHRGPDTVVSETTANCRMLSVPNMDRSRPALEAVRLACLCRRLGADLFVGSFYTCPASDIPSLLFVYDMEPERFPTMFTGDDDLLIAKRMAIRSAHSFVVLSPPVAADLSAFYDIDSERICCIPYLDWPGCSGMENFARNLLISGKCAAGSPLSLSESERRTVFIQSLHQQALCWQAYEYAVHAICKLLDHGCFAEAVALTRTESENLTIQTSVFDDALHRSRLPAGLLEQLLTGRAREIVASGKNGDAAVLLDEINKHFPRNATARELAESLGSH